MRGLADWVLRSGRFWAQNLIVGFKHNNQPRPFNNDLNYLPTGLERVFYGKIGNVVLQLLLLGQVRP